MDRNALDAIRKRDWDAPPLPRRNNGLQSHSMKVYNAVRDPREAETARALDPDLGTAMDDLEEVKRAERGERVERILDHLLELIDDKLASPKFRREPEIIQRQWASTLSGLLDRLKDYLPAPQALAAETECYNIVLEFPD